jgi:transcriptional regulator NrdR family protein
MTSNLYQLPLNFEQILALVSQLPDGEKLKLSQELEKYTRDRTLTQLLESFQTDEVSLDTINSEVETVRAELYARQQAH